MWNIKAVHVISTSISFKTKKNETLPNLDRKVCSGTEG